MGALWIAAAEPIRRGMSGSPILPKEGTAIGVISMSAGKEDNQIHASSAIFPAGCC